MPVSYPLRLALCGVRRPVALPANSARQSPLASGDDRAGAGRWYGDAVDGRSSSSPAGGSFGCSQIILALCTTAAALIGLGYLPAQGAWLLIAVGVLHSAALAPLPPLTDTLALGAAAPAGSGGAVIHYGWLRGCGSAAFALGLVLSGQVIGHFGIL